MSKKAKIPEGLDSAGADYWRTVESGWLLDDARRAVLLRACKVLDLIEKAEAELQVTGLTQLDRFGQRRQAPQVGVIRDLTSLFSRLVRSLDLAMPGEERPVSDRRGHP